MQIIISRKEFNAFMEFGFIATSKLDKEVSNDFLNMTPELFVELNINDGQIAVDDNHVIITHQEAEVLALCAILTRYASPIGGILFAIKGMLDSVKMMFKGMINEINTAFNKFHEDEYQNKE